MQKLFERIGRIELDLDPNQTGKVFNVLGEVFPSNQLERMLRDMYAHNNMTEALIKQRIIEEVDIERFKNITTSTLEGLAKKELNLSASRSHRARQAPARSHRNTRTRRRGTAHGHRPGEAEGERAGACSRHDEMVYVKRRGIELHGRLWRVLFGRVL